MAKVAGMADGPAKMYTSDMKIDFDGTTVLCRVCGDKASGFHYGVHSCEGCKGFFRRSIQQKIQYRPCTKNQQCAIQRINRNRCQYCRLKKCIEVGMSRDAVRFGRVPKREKAKIMAEMQKQNAKSQVFSLCTDINDQDSLLALIVKANEETCEYTKPKIIEVLEQWRVANHLPEFSSGIACPLTPATGSQQLQSGLIHGDGSALDDFSERFSPIIRGVVEFAKRLPGFLMLPQEDQVTLLKAGVFELLLVRLSWLFDSATDAMLCPNGQVLRRDLAALNGSNARFLVDSMFDFAQRFNQLDLSDAEIAVFSAIALMATDRPGLRSVELITRIQDAMKRCLQRLTTSSHPDQPEFYAQLMRRIPDLRTLNTLHSEKLLCCKMESGATGAGSRAARLWLPRPSVEADSPNSSFGRCGSSSPQSCSPTSVTSSEMTRAADSGVESGSDSKFELESESERRRILDGGLKTLQSSDMPVLKRALQAPPLTNASEIYAELYRTHKKFRAARRPEEGRVDSTTAPTQSPEPTSTKADDLDRSESKKEDGPTSSFAPARPIGMFRNDFVSPMASVMQTHMVPNFENYYGMGISSSAGMMPASIAAVAGSAFAAKSSPFSFVSPFYPQPDFRLMHQQLGNISLYPQPFEMPMGYFPMMQARMASMAFPQQHQMQFDSARSAPVVAETTSHRKSRSPSPSPSMPQKRPASSMSSDEADGDEPLNLSKSCKVVKQENWR